MVVVFKFSVMRCQPLRRALTVFSKVLKLSNCWICNAPANSGEHIVKKSDLKQMFPGVVNQQSPIYHRKNGEQKRPIGSLNAEALKYEKSICSNCNGGLTQRHDESWRTLSNTLMSLARQRCSTVDLKKVFPSSVYQSVINVQLFFAKLFGCKAIESGLGVDLTCTASSIVNNDVHPNIYLKFRHSDNGKSASYCAVSDFEVFHDKHGRLIYAHFYYTVGEYTVDVLYSENVEDLDMKGYFKPDQTITSFELCEVDYLQGFSEQKNS
ncbi:hypothetical protein VCSRO93_3604 [Vibrio cholerae]|nr:hypothetical protein VCSRO93_3604 [Vibrio cholerae]